MRILNVMPAVLSLLALMVLWGCQKPEPSALTDKVDFTPKKNKNSAVMPSALWFTTGNLSNGGFLGRLDLKTGEINHQVLPLEADTQVFQDGSDGLFVLTRQFLDSVRVLRGSDARVVSYRSLKPPRPDVQPNAQGVARDSKGRVWVTTMESDQVLVISPDLGALVGSVDLSSLKESNEPDAVADLAQIAMLDARHMVVTAQRLHRTSVSGWPPDEQSGMAVIDIETLQPVSIGLVNLVNPIEMAVRDGQVTVVGRGDLTKPDGAMGRIAGINAVSRAVDKSEDLEANVLAADLSVADAPPVLVAFYPKEKKSCVQIGAKQLVCSSENGGYAFLAVKRAGDRVFAAFQGIRDAQLWILDADGAAETKKVAMKMPIQSLSFGP